MLGIIGNGGIAGRAVRTAAVPGGQAGKKSVRPGAAAVSRGRPADGSAAAAHNAPGLECRHQRRAVRQHMRLNFRSVLPRTNGKWIGADLRERGCRSVLRWCGNGRDQKTREQACKQRESTATSTEKSIHRN